MRRWQLEVKRNSLPAVHKLPLVLRVLQGARDRHAYRWQRTSSSPCHQAPVFTDVKGSLQCSRLCRHAASKGLMLSSPGTAGRGLSPSPAWWSGPGSALPLQHGNGWGAMSSGKESTRCFSLQRRRTLTHVAPNVQSTSANWRIAATTELAHFPAAPSILPLATPHL